MKNRGANLELYVFEIGKGNDVGKLQSLLQTLEMQSLNLIIGGVNDTQIKVISDFSKERNIKYVIPFSQSNGEILNNGNIFQVNPLTKSQIDKASSKFIEKFRNSNVIFVSCGNNNKIEFITQLQNSLRTSNISFESVGSVSTLDSFLLSLLKPDRENIIIPTSGEMSDVSSIIDELKTLQESNSQIKIRLFGYPEWQTYNSLIGDFHHFDTYIYSPFFVNDNSTEVQTFKDKFSRWYNRSLLDTNPGYGMWGYDTGLFFLTAIQQYGVNFEQNIDKVQINSLQFPFNFVRLNNWGGFFNTGLYFINYEANGRLTKIDISK
jgi:ABC-type branched-subunit amino acid transport system substrate-binding protein